MTWIAISDHHSNLFAPNGVQTPQATSDTHDPLNRFMPKGSIILETRLSPQGRPQKLLGFHRSHPWVSSLEFQALPGGGIVLLIMQGDQVFHATIDHMIEDRTDALRITYSWDAPNRWGRLTVELPGTNRFATTVLKDPRPLYLADVREMVCVPGLRHMETDVRFFAVSDDIEPVGPMPALTSAVPILTARGYRPASSLKRGDLVASLDGELLPVLNVVHRTVPARGTFEPVHLRAPYFGLQKDIIVAPYQRLVIGGSRVEYLFGSEHVLVPVQYLMNGTAAFAEKGHALVTYSHVLLPDHEAVIAAGTAVESLNIGRIRRKKDLLPSTLLAQYERATLPDHSIAAYPVLRPFDAITLAEARAA